MLFSKDKKRLIMYPIGRRDTGFYYYVNNGVTEIGECAFSGAVNLTDVVLNNKIKEIGKSAFECCSGLKTVTLPYTIERIGSSAFLNCKSLEKVLIHKNVKSIGDRVFDNCSSRLKVIIDDNAYVEEYCKIRGIQVEKAGRKEPPKQPGSSVNPSETKQTASDSNKFTIDNVSQWIIGIYNKYKTADSDKIQVNNGFPIKSTSEERIARTAFGIPRDKKIFFLANFSLSEPFYVNPKGFALTSTGIYLRDENKRAACIDWDDFKNCRIYFENGLHLSEYLFVISEDRGVYHMLLTLQYYINASLQSKTKSAQSSGNTAEAKPSPKPAAENIPKANPTPRPAADNTPKANPPAANNSVIAIDRIGQGIINIYFKNKTSNSNKIKENNGLPIVNTPEENIARMAFGIPKDKKIFFIVNSNIISSFSVNSKGFALASADIYFRDEQKKTGYISWNGFADCHLYLKNGLYISKYFFILTNDKAVYQMLSALQSVIKNSIGIENQKAEINGKVSGDIIILDYIRKDIVKIYQTEKNTDSKKIIVNNGLNIQTLEAQTARRAFKIPENNKIFFIVNGNLFLGFDVNSKGFAVTSTGIYFRNENKLPGYMNFVRFIGVKVSVKLGSLYIGDNQFIIDNVNAVQNMLCELQNNIRYLRSIKAGS